MTMKEVERLAVEQTLEACEGNVSATARTLGVSRRWVQYRLKEWAEA
jgi:ActR/RegA family two-component response regulator